MYRYIDIYVYIYSRPRATRQLAKPRPRRVNPRGTMLTRLHTHTHIRIYSTYIDAYTHISLTLSLGVHFVLSKCVSAACVTSSHTLTARPGRPSLGPRVSGMCVIPTLCRLFVCVVIARLAAPPCVCLSSVGQCQYPEGVVVVVVILSYCISLCLCSVKCEGEGETIMHKRHCSSHIHAHAWTDCEWEWEASFVRAAHRSLFLLWSIYT